MTITLSLVVDIVIVAFWAIFIYRGVKQGLFMSVFTTLAVILALACGWALSCHCPDTLPDMFRPGIENRIEDYTVANQTSPDSTSPTQMGYSEPFSDVITDEMQNPEAAPDEGSSSMGSAIANIAARSVMFLAGFAVVMAVWGILARLLDLVTRFPVLHAVDRILGGIMGLFLGYIFLLLIHWVLCDLLACIPQSLLAGSYLTPLLISRPFFFFVAP